MKITTKYLGEVTIDKKDIINFKSGILGFEEEKEFVLLGVPNDELFGFLQSIHNSNIAFLLINPWDFFLDYDIEIPDEDLAKIGIHSNEEGQMAVYTIITLGETLKTSTTNLLAPIIINVKDNTGKQFILNDTNYTTKHKLFPQEIGG